MCLFSKRVVITTDNEENPKMSEIFEILLLAGCFRIRIPSLNNFYKIVGGLFWCIMKMIKISKKDPLRAYSALIKFRDVTAFKTYNKLCLLISWKIDENKIEDFKKLGKT